MEDAINYILMALGVAFTISVPLALFGLRLQEGFWGNTVCFSNITFSSLIAFNYFEPIAGLLVDAYVGGLFFYDFLSFWLLFSLVYFILNTVTNSLSKIKVHFPKVVEQVGNWVLLFAIFFNFVSIIFFTLPMAPFQPAEGAMQTEADRSEFFGRKARILSIGTLSAFTGEKIWIDPQVYAKMHTDKRWMLVSNAIEKQTMLYDGSAPPRVAGSGSASPSAGAE